MVFKKLFLYILSILLFNVYASVSKEHTGELLYRFKESLRKSDSSSNIYQIYRPLKNNLAEETLEKVRQKMIQSDQFEFVVYNTVEKPLINLQPNGNSFSQWHHNNIKTKSAWKVTQGSSQVVVAVCDSGLEHEHSAFKNKTAPGWNFRTNNRDTSPQTTHGTFVAGIIAGTPEKNFTGIAPKIKIMPLVITNNSGSTTIKIISDCITYAADQGAKVINVSFTGINSPVINAAGKYARDKGSLVVYAAGNRGKRRSIKTYPDWKSILAVGATTRSDQRWKWKKMFKQGGSNYGYFIDLVAPGHNMVSTNAYLTFNKSNPYRKGSGTSYAAPVVSAVAGLVFSLNKNFTPEKVEQILIESSDIIGSEFVFGAGRVNANRAVELAISH
ncbi:S8 family serine peptidase [Bacteriovoracaceae bacterium]|nr:S8 family serine peptidase [Bacteriovoracaceae bacterium]